MALISISIRMMPSTVCASRGDGARASTYGQRVGELPALDPEAERRDVALVAKTIEGAGTHDVSARAQLHA